MSVFVEIILRLAKFSQLEECPAKQGEVRKYRYVSTNCRHESHKSGNGFNLRLVR